MGKKEGGAQLIMMTGNKRIIIWKKEKKKIKIPSVEQPRICDKNKKKIVRAV